MVMAEPAFHQVGTVTDNIEVEITYQIIGLFSEGLYSSANKAIEELVSNSFDADARQVHVVVSRDLGDGAATIAVLDDGIGMDPAGLKIHWIVGDSIKKRSRTTASGRRTIGKFGIGKLAAYVLGNRLTHISCVDGAYSSTTMDFSSIPSTVNLPRESFDDGVAPPPAAEAVLLDLRTLTEQDARSALQPWLDAEGSREGIRLFGEGAARSWTIAIISELKPMAQELSLGRLRWVLSTAMPLRDDFKLYLNAVTVEPSKLSESRVGAWILGKDLTDVPKPAPSELASEKDLSFPEADYSHYYVIDQVLGPITGYLEVYQDTIDTGKSDEMVGRSNGFFVYVHGRLINPDDAGFGIDRNTLRHGTFSRFRVVVNIDRLDEELRSSRESLREGPRLIRARELLQGIFNFARNRLESHEEAEAGGRRASQRLTDSPASLSERPILRMILDSYESGSVTRHIDLGDTSGFADSAALRAHIEDRIASDKGIVADIELADLGTYEPLAVLNALSGVLSVNLEHPFVAYFAEDFTDVRRNLPLQLFAISEITLEAQLRAAGIPAGDVDDVLSERDELLRHLARANGRRNSLTVAQELVNAGSSKAGLEEALVAVFDQLGFEAVPKGGKNDSDGLAEAHLPAIDGVVGHYRVSLEAKSKETPGAKVKKSQVEVSTIARHRDKNNCDHAIVVGPSFETGKDDEGAVVEEIDKDREHNPGKTITLMDIDDLARLVRGAPVKRINLAALRELFKARTPAEASAWVDSALSQQHSSAPYRDILETVWSEQQAQPDHAVMYSAVRVLLRTGRGITMAEGDLRDECAALARMAPNLFFARSDRVELNTKPEKVLEAIHDYIEHLPKETEA